MSYQTCTIKGCDLSTGCLWQGGELLEVCTEKTVINLNGLDIHPRNWSRKCFGSP